jgi:hypothetical protein
MMGFKHSTQLAAWMLFSTQGCFISAPNNAATIETSGPSTSSGSPAEVASSPAPSASQAAAPTPARYQGLTLRQREYAEAEDQQFANDISNVADRCGQRIESEIHWPSFVNEIEEGLNGGPRPPIHSICRTLLSHVYMTCQDGPASRRQAILQRIREYRCTNSPSGRTLQLQGNTVTVGVQLQASNYDDWIRDQLGRVL